MTKFTEWVLIPHNRKFYLPPEVKVQVIRNMDSVSFVEEYGVIEYAQNLNCDGLWDKDIFAYRMVIEPVEKVDTYDAWLSNGNLYRAKNGTPKGTAKLTKIDGKAVKLIWEADE